MRWRQTWQRMLAWRPWNARQAPLGRRGERLAARWLMQRGYRILERNFRLGDDEADLLAVDPDGRTIVIVEVKTRSRDSIVPEAAVTAKKRKRLSRLAARLKRTQQFADRPMRFDAVAVVWPEGREPLVRHTPGAFYAPW